MQEIETSLTHGGLFTRLSTIQEVCYFFWVDQRLGLLKLSTVMVMAFIGINREGSLFLF